MSEQAQTASQQHRHHDTGATCGPKKPTYLLNSRHVIGAAPRAVWAPVSIGEPRSDVPHTRCRRSIQHRLTARGRDRRSSTPRIRHRLSPREAGAEPPDRRAPNQGPPPISQATRALGRRMIRRPVRQSERRRTPTGCVSITGNPTSGPLTCAFDRSSQALRGSAARAFRPVPGVRMVAGAICQDSRREPRRHSRSYGDGSRRSPEEHRCGLCGNTRHEPERSVAGR